MCPNQQGMPERGVPDVNAGRHHRKWGLHIAAGHLLLAYCRIGAASQRFHSLSS